MTDDPTTDAELISAYLDGEATPDEVARVRAEPSLLSAVAELETIRGQLSVDGPPPGLVDDHVGAALAAFDGEQVQDEPPTAAVTDLAARRPLLQRLPLGAIAAAVVLIALFGALAQIDTGDDDGSSDETAASMSDDGDDAAEADGEADLNVEEDAASDAPDASAGAGHSARSFLAFSTTDDLAQHLSGRYDELAAVDETQSAEPETSTTAAAVEDADRSVDPCNAVTVAGVAPPTVTFVFPAVVSGAPVTAVVTETDDGRRLVVVDDGSCTVIDDRPL